jgi:protein RecA
MSEQKEKLKALQQTIERLEKSYGKGIVMRMDDNKKVNIDVISTGSFGLDIALGVGGFPRGRIVEIYGPESSGKTTIALHTIAQAQKKGGICAFIDAEHAFDKFYAEKLGIDTSSLLISQPNNGEQAQAESAKRICKRCPHLAECFEWALNYERFGVWGATSPRERMRIRRKLNIKVKDNLVA